MKDCNQSTMPYTVQVIPVMDSLYAIGSQNITKDKLLVFVNELFHVFLPE